MRKQVMPVLEIGKFYKIRFKDVKANSKYKKADEGRLVYLDDRLAVFDNGRYRDCQMVKNYKCDWEVMRG
ncbi:hypothetical protein [Anaerococcus tetradius]|uniref:Uncharacterized protein n=1 Tax=Anaerococcus tetradius ATCC 35098 TaxID=525255 RepID=C2CG02_9FIRM|nr:hypothetical protein [Anaerococcus tetradius]EEI83530.1 hypothetical protein HMPREF0077_0412 [Anaerococcus tetradius ATCC 35098]